MSDCFSKQLHLGFDITWVKLFWLPGMTFRSKLFTIE
jgi:hypothetical protein